MTTVFTWEYSLRASSPSSLPNPDCLNPPKGAWGGTWIPAVDPDAAPAHVVRDGHCLVDVVGHDPRGKTIHGRIGALHDLVYILELDQALDRREQRARGQRLDQLLGPVCPPGSLRGIQTVRIWQGAWRGGPEGVFSSENGCHQDWAEEFIDWIASTLAVAWTRRDVIRATDVLRTFVGISIRLFSKWFIVVMLFSLNLNNTTSVVINIQFWEEHNYELYILVHYIYFIYYAMRHSLKKAP